MKCPKCSYLGFDTGDRCKNCGYDFSLVPADYGEDHGEHDLAMRPSDDVTADVQWDDSFDQAMTALASFPDISESIPPTPDPEAFSPEPQPPVQEDAHAPASDPLAGEEAPTREQRTSEAPRTAAGLPLFTEAFDDFGEEPLIKVPAAPRPPLAVRRTPRTPRLRVVPKASRRAAATSASALELWDAPSDAVSDTVPDVARVASAPLNETHVGAAAVEPQSRSDEGAEVSGAARRLAAVALDHVLLGMIDVLVVYFTLRMVGLPMADWRVLPFAPLAAFLLFVKLSYFWAFTAVGGQTIGKMAAHIRVVTMENAPLDGSGALTRALAAAVSAAVLGLGYLPALASPGRLALHDYVTRTRVIVLPST